MSGVIVEFAVSRGKRSFAALLPDNAYGTVVEAAFQQEVPVAAAGSWCWKIPTRCEPNVRGCAPRCAKRRARSTVSFIPDSPDAVPQVVQALAANGVDLEHVQLLGTGLWGDDTRILVGAIARGRLVSITRTDRLP